MNVSPLSLLEWSVDWRPEWYGSSKVGCQYVKWSVHLQVVVSQFVNLASDPSVHTLHVTNLMCHDVQYIALGIQ